MGALRSSTLSCVWLFGLHVSSCPFQRLGEVVAHSFAPGVLRAGALCGPMDLQLFVGEFVGGRLLSWLWWSLGALGECRFQRGWGCPLITPKTLGFPRPNTMILSDLAQYGSKVNPLTSVIFASTLVVISIAERPPPHFSKPLAAVQPPRQVASPS